MMYSKRIRDIPGLVHRLQYRNSVDAIRYNNWQTASEYRRAAYGFRHTAIYDNRLSPNVRRDMLEEARYCRRKYRLALQQIRDNRLGKLFLNFIPFHHVGSKGD